ncbi:hypothetical protein SS50377_27290 [Spironucleus salmonicida]|uniref:Uncharacterized protein n=1 Tax=Spironucleus salmonicida TaxID=348837 RepID=A0A9P8LMN4_9EUKA|nr:hypothetical protein SS50377_27272 [Spironucleus salmonicida]KAH0570996.1 hypothetical protein SS50377_27290 [Spironucleus salmonicida]
MLVQASCTGTTGGRRFLLSCIPQHAMKIFVTSSHCASVRARLSALNVLVAHGTVCQMHHGQEALSLEFGAGIAQPVLQLLETLYVMGLVDEVIPRGLTLAKQLQAVHRGILPLRDCNCFFADDTEGARGLEQQPENLRS